MTEPTQPEFSADELATLKLAHDFNAAVRGRVAVLRQEMQQNAQAVYQAAQAEAEAMSDEDLDAAIVRTLVEQDPPLTEEDAKEMMQGISREQKASFLADDEAQAEAKAQVEAMTDEDLDTAVLAILVDRGMPDEAAAESLADASREQKVAYMSSRLAAQIADEIGSKNTMSDEDLDAAVVKGLMAQNPGTSDESAKQQLEGVSRENKVKFMMQQFAEPELEKIPRVAHPGAAVVAEMGIDFPAMKAQYSAIIDKHGEEAVRTEMGKIQAAAAPAPQVP